MDVNFFLSLEQNESKTDISLLSTAAFTIKFLFTLPPALKGTSIALTWIYIETFWSFLTSLFWILELWPLSVELFLVYLDLMLSFDFCLPMIIFYL